MSSKRKIEEKNSYDTKSNFYLQDFLHLRDLIYFAQFASANFMKKTEEDECIGAFFLFPMCLFVH